MFTSLPLTWKSTGGKPNVVGISTKNQGQESWNLDPKLIAYTQQLGKQQTATVTMPYSEHCNTISNVIYSILIEHY